MYYDESSTWASIEDLYARYGEEFVNKLGIRRKYDSQLQSYVADESQESILKVISLALCDARDLIRRKLQCRYSGVDKLDAKVFPAIKIWHLRLTIETLKSGGDCLSCACNVEMEKEFDCGNLCSEDGDCLISNKTFFSVSKPEFHCECLGRCSCRC